MKKKLTNLKVKLRWKFILKRKFDRLMDDYYYWDEVVFNNSRFNIFNDSEIEIIKHHMESILEEAQNLR